jgi:hypothetical protein
MGCYPAVRRKGVIEPFDPPAAVIAAARGVLDGLPEMPLYARVDLVLRDGEFVLMELEIKEPGLVLQTAPGSAERFADATIWRLGTTPKEVGHAG